MGQYADDILNGDVDQYTGEWIGDGQGFPRSITVRDHDPVNYAKGTRAIRKELAILIKSEKTKIPNITIKQENKLVEDCRAAINKKYGKGWREQF